MKVILSGGGTGGHIYPALAIARGILDRDPSAQILYVGTEKGMESTIVPRAGLAFQTVDIQGINRASLLKASKSLIKIPKSFWQARTILKEFQPDIVIGTGGYVSYPVVLAASYTNARTIIHEQNAFPGLANRTLAKRVDDVMLTFEEASPYFKGARVKVTGLPVRPEISQVDVDKARKSLNFKADLFTLVAFGGSRGAMSINKAMLQLMERYGRENIQIIWITGQEGYDKIQEELAARVKIDSRRCRLEIRPYMYDIEQALAVSDLAVCRAGASTLCELEVIGLPAILVPYPYAAENHQEKNARALVNKNAAAMIIDEFLDGDTLYNKIEDLRKNPHVLAEMKQNMKREARPDALEDILAVVMK
jgi:UDP-N-acetylglucosamine--N-acetylmuramyl-(pentapeptide) pyrophosphoryl-undecaprenol N-acetylglucosamine transferase